MAWYEERECAICGKVFTPDRRNQYCCSYECQRRRSAQIRHDFYHGMRQKKDALEARVDALEREVKYLRECLQKREGRDGRIWDTKVSGMWQGV